MHREKYFTLLPPFVILMLISIFTLPQRYMVYIFIVPTVFWITCYVGYILKRKNRKQMIGSKRIISIS